MSADQLVFARLSLLRDKVQPFLVVDLFCSRVVELVTITHIFFKLMGTHGHSIAIYPPSYIHAVALYLYS